MAITFANVTNSDTFSTWLIRTNQIANAFGTAVTAEANAASGNAAVTGYFVANGFVGNNITVTGSAGGNLTVSSANLVIAANSKLSSLGGVAVKGTLTIDTLSSVNTGTAANATHYLLAANSANGSSWYYANVVSNFTTNLSTTGTLSVTGNSTLSANVTIGQNLDVTNAVNFANTLTVGGTSTFTGNATFNANVSIAQRLSVTNSVSLSNSVSIGGGATLSSTLGVTGAATFSNTIAVTGAATFSNTATISGNVVLGTTRISANGGVGTAGQVLTSGAGTGNVYWSTITSSGGTVTNIASGAGLTGGPITSTGTLSVQANAGIVANSTGVFVNASSVTQGILPVARGGTGVGTSTGTGSVVLSASPTVTGTFTAQTMSVGNTTVSGNLDVSGYANIVSTANVGGAVSLRSTLTVNGAVTVANTLAAGNTSLNGSLGVSGVTTLANTTVSGRMTVANGIVLTTNSSITGMEESLTLALSDEITNITTGVSKITFRAPYAWTLTRIPRASLAVASSGGAPAVDINVNGVSIFSTVLTIDEAEKTSTTAAVPAVLSTTSIPDDAEITMDIDTAGLGAKGLKVTLYYKRT